MQQDFQDLQNPPVKQGPSSWPALQWHFWRIFPADLSALVATIAFQHYYFIFQNITTINTYAVYYKFIQNNFVSLLPKQPHISWIFLTPGMSVALSLGVSRWANTKKKDLSREFRAPHNMKNKPENCPTLLILFPDAPWCWNIYLHLGPPK